MSRQMSAAAAAAAVLLSATAAQAAGSCSLAALKGAAPGAVLESAREVAAPIPYCRIDGHVITTNPGPNKVGFMVALPRSGWNGRYFFNSVGGSVGFIQEPAADLLTEGFAIATTDAGHRSTSMLDWSGIKDPAQAFDMAGRSIHVSAQATQGLAKAFYKTDRMYRYVQGCSGGGTRVLNEARRWPDDFDGFIAEAPGIFPGEILQFAWIDQYIIKNPQSWISPAKVALIEAKVNRDCHAIDGVVPDAASCRFDPASLRCPAGDGPDCLTDAQIGLVQRIIGGARSPKGQIHPGLPITNATGWIGFHTGTKPPPWSETDMGAGGPAGHVISHSYMRAFFGDQFNYVADFDFGRQKDVDAYIAADAKAYMSQQDFDLSAMAAKGKKLIMWHGVSDPGISFREAMRYFEGARAKVGAERFDKLARLYGPPGVLHCGGGTGPVDMGARTRAKMVDWVEHGVEPGALVATRTVQPGGQTRQFLVCPYPMVAVFAGASETTQDPTAALMSGKLAYNASNWSCRAP
ncbi:MAG: hypothetical protein JWQ29_2339 [Phenylobacterium sp.]|nr:hypothetical protein [Phenylobacterium sp.]